MRIPDVDDRVALWTPRGPRVEAQDTRTASSYEGRLLRVKSILRAIQTRRRTRLLDDGPALFKDSHVHEALTAQCHVDHTTISGRQILECRVFATNKYL